MNGSGWPPPEGVPTLTEVVAWPSAEQEQLAQPQLAPSAEAMPLEQGGAVPAGAAPGMPAMTEEQLIARVLADLQRQVDLMLEYRLREILTPIVTRAADGVIRDTRTELASTLRDVVARAVAQEMMRHRSR